MSMWTWLFHGAQLLWKIDEEWVGTRLTWAFLEGEDNKIHLFPFLMSFKAHPQVQLSCTRGGPRTAVGWGTPAPLRGQQPYHNVPSEKARLLQYTDEDHSLVKGILVAASPLDEFSRPICSIKAEVVFCMVWVSCSSAVLRNVNQ